MRQIYLDYNATTPVAPSVFEVMRPFLVEHFGNPSSRHAFGIAAHQAIEDARQSVADALGVSVSVPSRGASQRVVSSRRWATSSRRHGGNPSQETMMSLSRDAALEIVAEREDHDS